MASTTINVFIIPLFLLPLALQRIRMPGAELRSAWTGRSPVTTRSSCQSDHINFYQDIFWQPRYFDRGSGRGRLLEVAAVDFVHGHKVSHVFQEDGAAEDLVHGAARGLQDGGEILQHAVGLGAYVARDDLLGGGIDGDLSGREDQALSSDGLRVRADGLGGVLG